MALKTLQQRLQLGAGMQEGRASFLILNCRLRVKPHQWRVIANKEENTVLSLLLKSYRDISGCAIAGGHAHTENHKHAKTWGSYWTALALTDQLHSDKR